VPRQLTHEAKASEVASLALGPLIVLGAGGVVTGEVEVTDDGTHSGHHLLELLLLVVPEAVLLLALVLVAGVVPVVVVILVGGVELLPLGAVGDEVGGVAALEAAPRRPLPLLLYLFSYFCSSPWVAWLSVSEITYASWTISQMARPCLKR
jgi:hypothetical protein